MYVCVRVCVCVYVCVSVCVHVFLCLSVRLCMCVLMYVSEHATFPFLWKSKEETVTTLHILPVLTPFNQLCV